MSMSNSEARKRAVENAVQAMKAEVARDHGEQIAKAIEAAAKCSCRDSYCAIRSSFKTAARIARATEVGR